MPLSCESIISATPSKAISANISFTRLRGSCSSNAERHMTGAA